MLETNNKKNLMIKIKLRYRISKIKLFPMRLKWRMIGKVNKIILKKIQSNMIMMMGIVKMMNIIIFPNK